LIADQSTAEPNADVSQDDDYIVMYTSGTTGRPKGVVHEHRDMIEHSMSVLVDQQLTRDDVGLSAAPLYHSAELHVFLIPRIHVEATNIIQHAFDPEETLSMLAEHDVTVLFGAPTMWLAMLQQARSRMTSPRSEWADTAVRAWRQRLSAMSTSKSVATSSSITG
jgi:long-chain acyl-CoA synthetase